MLCSTLAAEYYPRTKRGPATLVLNRIVGGHRTKVIGFNVASKREARELAQRYRAEPWNF